MNASTLKWIALASMLADHIGCLLILLSRLPESGNDPKLWYNSIFFLRTVGRIAFPIFTFLLVEGFRHTHNRKRYAARLVMFAIISEFPHYLFFDRIYASGAYQLNIGVTLLLLFCLMYGYKKIRELGEKRNRYTIPVLSCILLVLTCLAVHRFPIGYGYPGVLLCTVFYGIRHRIFQPVLGYLVIGIRSTFRIGYLLPFALLAFYNGQPGKSHKSFFYLFYPIHLLALWGIYLWIEVS